MEPSVRKLLEYSAIAIVGFIAKYILDMKKSLDAAHVQKREHERRIKALELKVGDGS